MSPLKLMIDLTVCYHEEVPPRERLRDFALLIVVLAVLMAISVALAVTGIAAGVF
jgi:hypothetical protein